MKKAFLLGLPVCLGSLLAGCAGYQPLYGEKQQEAVREVAVGQVVMAGYTLREGERSGAKPGERRAAQLVTRRLQATFGAGEGGRYALDAAITEGTSTLAVRRDATDQRLQVNLLARIVLHDEQSGNDVLRADVAASAAYNVETTPYGTEAGRERAKAAAATVLADEMVRRVRLYLAQETK